MTKKNKKLKGISGYYNDSNVESVKGHTELIVREAFLRTTKEMFDDFGIENYTIERMRGMVDFLEQFNFVQNEINN